MKYTQKKKIKYVPNFENDIKAFVQKVDFVADKKSLTGLMTCLFETLEELGVNMWDLKSRLSENLRKLSIRLYNDIDKGTLGRYFDGDNIIEIKGQSVQRTNIMRNIIHEVLHCMSSQREYFYAKAGKGNKAVEKFVSCGFVNYLEETYSKDQKHYWIYSSIRAINEGVTELLTSKIASNYFGGEGPNVYPTEKKFASQLYAIFGSELLQSYFDNDFTFLAELFGKKENDVLSKYYKSGLDDFSFEQYMEVANSVLYEDYSEYEKSIPYNFYDSIHDLNSLNFAMFTTKLLRNIYNNKERFFNGNEVKQTILKSFDLFAKTVYMENTSDERMKDFWLEYADTMLNCCEICQNMFLQECNIFVPDLREDELLQHIKYSQTLCRNNYFDCFDMDYISLDRIIFSNIESEIEKSNAVYKKNIYSQKKYIKTNIFADITKPM